MAVNGNYIITANYISDLGVAENFRKKNVIEMITPIEKNGVSTWEYFTQDKLEKALKRCGRLVGEYMCDPVTGSKREFRKELFKYITWQEVKNKKTLCFITIDSAVSKKSATTQVLLLTGLIRITFGISNHGMKS